MGHKKVCLSCRLCLNREICFDADKVLICPQCGKPLKLLPHRFRPPKKADSKGWQLVVFLIDNGFTYQHIYQVGKSELIKGKYDNYVPYPKNLRDAKEFIEQYKKYAKSSKS